MAQTGAASNEVEAKRLLDRLSALPMSRWSTAMLFMAGALLLFDNSDNSIAAASEVSIQRVLHVSLVVIGTMISAGLIGATISSIFAGSVQMRFGRRKTLSVMLTWFCIFTVLAAVSSNITELIIFRFLSGLGFGGLIPIGWSFANEVAPRRWLGRMNAWMDMIGYGGGSVVAYGIGVLVVAPFGFRVGFGVMAAEIILVLIIVFFMPESIPYLVRKGKLEQAEEMVAKIERRVLRGTPPPPLPASALTESLHAEATVSVKAAIQVMFGTWRRVVRTSAAVGTWWVHNLVLVSTFYPILLVEYRHVPQKSALFYLFVASLVSIAGRFCAGPVSDMVNKRVLTGLTVFVDGIGATYVILVPGISGGTLLAVVCIAYFITGFWGACMFAYVPTVFPAAVKSTALGIFVAGSTGVGFIQPILMGGLLGALGAIPVVFTSAVVCLLWALLTVFTGRREELAEQRALLATPGSIKSAR